MGQAFPEHEQSRPGAVLSWAGFRLRGLGRLKEAAEPMKVSNEMLVKKEDWERAAANASNLSELYLTLGALPQAVEYGRLSVEYADRSGDDFQKESKRATYADALHQSGKPEEAERLFAEAEAMQQKRRPEFRYLFSLSGYQYCDLLLGLGKGEEVLERVSRFFEWRQSGDSLLDIALENLSCGRAHALLAQETSADIHCEGAEHEINLAVEGLRKAGEQIWLCRGLLARAAWHRHFTRLAQAESDLQEALEIAESGSMGLYLVDYHLEMAHLRRAQGRDAEAEQHKAEALQRVKETGYLRRLEAAEGV